MTAIETQQDDHIERSVRDDANPKQSHLVSTHVATQVPAFGQPTETFEIADGSAGQTNISDDEYPKGTKLWSTTAALMMASLIFGLDFSILSVAVPAITNDFKTIADIGWYNSVGGLVGSAATMAWSKAYTLFSIKKLFIASILIFEIGSAICTSAPNSAVFIVGRAFTGAGAAGMKVGIFTIMTFTYPLHVRPTWSSFIGFAQTGTSVMAPLIGGAIIDGLSWRLCFGINLPLGCLSVAAVWYGFNVSTTRELESLPFKEKMRRLDPLGSLVFVPAIVCLMLVLQFGGMTYGWDNARIIVLLAVFAVLMAVFAWFQYRAGENAVIPVRILKNRNILAGSWFETSVESVVVVTEYYMSIYLQGVRGFSAFRSGLLGLPMIAAFCLTLFIAGIGTTRIGYYNPFVYLTVVLGPIASGLMTTLDPTTDLPRVLAFYGFVGAAAGFGIGAPIMAYNACLHRDDVPIGVGIGGFAVRLGSALFMSISATLFRNRLQDDIETHAPSANFTLIEHAGLSDIRKVVGPQRLRDVLLGYGEAVSQTLYLPLALSLTGVIGAVFMQWIPLKKKEA